MLKIKYYTKGNPNPQLVTDDWTDLFKLPGHYGLWWGHFKNSVMPTEVTRSIEETSD